MSEMDYWFQTADGIRIHYAQQREQEQEDHRRKMDRINREENDMIDALRKTKLPSWHPAHRDGTQLPILPDAQQDIEDMKR